MLDKGVVPPFNRIFVKHLFTKTRTPILLHDRGEHSLEMKPICAKKIKRGNDLKGKIRKHVERRLLVSSDVDSGLSSRGKHDKGDVDVAQDGELHCLLGESCLALGVGYLPSARSLQPPDLKLHSTHFSVSLSFSQLSFLLLLLSAVLFCF